MRRTCQFWVLRDGTESLPPGSQYSLEVPCGKPAVATITWPGYMDSTIYWYCAEHYDKRLAFVRDCGRRDVLELSGAV